MTTYSFSPKRGAHTSRHGHCYDFLSQLCVLSFVQLRVASFCLNAHHFIQTTPIEIRSRPVRFPRTVPTLSAGTGASLQAAVGLNADWFGLGFGLHGYSRSLSSEKNLRIHSRPTAGRRRCDRLLRKSRHIETLPCLATLNRNWDRPVCAPVSSFEPDNYRHGFWTCHDAYPRNNPPNRKRPATLFHIVEPAT